MPLFDPKFLEKIEYLALVSRRAFRGQLFAQRRGRRLGTGVEFADHRDYAPGDELRDIDWNIYARHGELLLKRFQEEEDLHVYFLLDCSLSMGFGNPCKFDHARQTLAAMAYIALDDLDCVGVTAFADDVIGDFAMVRGKQRIHPIMRFLENQKLRQGGTTSLERSVRTFVGRRQRRGLVVLISDFYDPAGFQRGLDLLRHERYDPFLVQIYDCSEARPPLRGEIELVDAETQQLETVSITRRARQAYLQRYQVFLDSIAAYCRKHNCGHISASTEKGYEELILDMMRAAGVRAGKT